MQGKEHKEPTRRHDGSGAGCGAVEKRLRTHLNRAHIMTKSLTTRGAVCAILKGNVFPRHFPIPPRSATGTLVADWREAIA